MHLSILSDMPLKKEDFICLSCVPRNLQTRMPGYDIYCAIRMQGRELLLARLIDSVGMNVVWLCYQTE